MSEISVLMSPPPAGLKDAIADAAQSMEIEFSDAQLSLIASCLAACKGEIGVYKGRAFLFAALQVLSQYDCHPMAIAMIQKNWQEILQEEK